MTQHFRDKSSPQRPGHLECGRLNDQTSKDAVEGIHHDATMMLMMQRHLLRMADGLMMYLISVERSFSTSSCFSTSFELGWKPQR